MLPLIECSLVILWYIVDCSFIIILYLIFQEILHFLGIFWFSSAPRILSWCLEIKRCIFQRWISKAKNCTRFLLPSKTVRCFSWQLKYDDSEIVFRRRFLLPELKWQVTVCKNSPVFSEKLLKFYEPWDKNIHLKNGNSTTSCSV